MSQPISLSGNLTMNWTGFMNFRKRENLRAPNRKMQHPLEYTGVEEGEASYSVADHAPEKRLGKTQPEAGKHNRPKRGS